MVLLFVAIALFYGGIFTLKSQANGLNLSEAQVDKVENIINVLTLNIDEIDSSGRGHLVQNALYYLDKNPIFGNGIDFAISKSAHNTYLGVWLDAGIFTFLFFLCLLFYFFFRSLTIRSNLKLFAMSILITLYVFMASLQTVINQPYLIVLFAFVGYIIHYSEMNEEQLTF